MTIEEAKELGYLDWLHHTYRTQGNGTEPLRVRVNGAPQTWKRDPTRIRIPVKWGMYGYGQLFAFDLPAWHRGETCDECKARIEARIEASRRADRI